MKLIDLSQPIFDGCPNCPAHPPVKVERIADHPRDGWRMELLTIASHTGSHVDAPLHKLARGRNLDQMPLDRFTGEAFIADLRDSQPGQPLISSRIQCAVLEKDLEDRILLLATGWGDRRAHTDEWLRNPPFVSPEAAEWLVSRKIRGLGIDHYSIGGCTEPFNSRTHEILLGAGIWIVEELHFPKSVFTLPGPTEFWSLPVNFQGCSGAFCRPVLVVRDTPSPAPRKPRRLTKVEILASATRRVKPRRKA